MITKMGWNRELALSLFKKETSYNAGVTMNSSNDCLMSGWEGEPVDWDDKVESDKAQVTGLEHGYDQEIVRYGAKLSYKEPKAKPNSVAGLAALILGSVVSTQDGAHAGWHHRIVPVTAGTALASIQVDEKIGGIQYAYTGFKGGTLKLAGKADDGFVSLEASLTGSGSRATSAVAFPAKIVESWLLLSNAQMWLESGANISIAAGPTHGAEDISSATPDIFSPRMKSFDFTWDNKLEAQYGIGGAGILHDISYGRRTADLKFTLLFNDAAELAYYEAQTIVAVELDLRGSLIDQAGSMYYGLQLVIPKLRLKKSPSPKGGPGDELTADYDFEVFDDGTHSAVILDVWNAQAAYLA